jgi:hypothetical protein
LVTVETSTLGTENKAPTGIGRELVLPARAKLGMSARVAACTRAAGLTFGAADVEFLHYSDSACCCSGVDKLQGFQGFYRHQIAYALHINRGSTVSLDQIGMEWTPARSIDRFMNSRSRLSTRTSKIGSMQDHIERRWNDLRSPLNPARFWGVKNTGALSPQGHRIYSVESELT